MKLSASFKVAITGIALAMTVLAPVAHAATVTWTGTTNMNWGPVPDTTSWSATFNNGDTAIFTATGAGTVTIDAGGVAPARVDVQGGAYTFSGGPISDASSGFVSLGTGVLTMSIDNNTYTGKTTLSASAGAGNPTWAFTKLTNAGVASSFGAPTGANAIIDVGGNPSSGGFRYDGTTDSTTDRALNFVNGAGGNYYLKINSTNSATPPTLKFTSDFTSSWTTVGARTLIFDRYGVTNKNGKIWLEGKLVDSAAGALNVTVDDNENKDFVKLTGLSTYTGTTTVGRNSWLTINTIKDLGQASAIGAPTTVNAGRVHLGGSAGTATLLYIGTGDTTNREVRLLSDGDGRGGRIEMAGSGTLKFTSAISSGGANSALLTLQGATAGVGEIAGIISSATAVGKTTSILKSGTGTWVLSGNNTYTGTTSVSAGRLFINGNQSAANGAVSVAAAATLGGSGTIGGATTFSGASFLRPGSIGTDTGVLGFGNNLTLSTTGTTFIDITGTTRGSLYDGVNVSGALAYGGRLQFAIASLVTGTFDIFNIGGSQSGNFTGLSGTIGGTALSFSNASGVWTAPFTVGSTTGTATFTQSTGDLVIVPEPATLALAAIGGSALVWVACRRRRVAR